MSYDLYFYPREGALDRQRFEDFFFGRARYKTERGQAFYESQDTGVYFGFELQEPDPEADADEPQFPIAFNINYFRPSYFVLEAVPEVTAFVRALDLLVMDPQVDGMGQGEYDPDRLVSGWNHGNEFGYQAILGDAEKSGPILSLPTSTLMDMWRWNYGRAALQQELGGSRFVPAVMTVLRGGQPCTAAVWPDGIPIAVPPVDFFFVPREELAPRKFLRRVKDMAIVDWKDALPLLEKHRSARHKDVIVLDYERCPADVRKFVEALPPDANSGIEGIGRDRVLNRELVERYSASRG